MDRQGEAARKDKQTQAHTVSEDILAGVGSVWQTVRAAEAACVHLGHKGLKNPENHSHS